MSVAGGGYWPPAWPPPGCFPAVSALSGSQAPSLPSCIPAVYSWVAFRHVAATTILAPLSVLTLSPRNPQLSLAPCFHRIQPISWPSAFPHPSYSAFSGHSLFLLERGAWGPGICMALIRAGVTQTPQAPSPTAGQT